MLADAAGDLIAHRIESEWPDADVSIETSDCVHYKVTVYTSAFQNKTLLQQHRMVYGALHDCGIGTTVHALSIKTGVK